MKNPFARAGFDSLIAEGSTVNGSFVIKNGQTAVVDGKVDGQATRQEDITAVDKSTLVVNGEVRCKQIHVSNVTITGTLSCDRLVVEGQLAIKSGANVTVGEIQYRDLVIENGAIVRAQMNHLDHISAGEQIQAFAADGTLEPLT